MQLPCAKHLFNEDTFVGHLLLDNINNLVIARTTETLALRTDLELDREKNHLMGTTNGLNKAILINVIKGDFGGETTLRKINKFL